jgi:hypothetical protein
MSKGVKKIPSKAKPNKSKSSPKITSLMILQEQQQNDSL